MGRGSDVENGSCRNVGRVLKNRSGHTFSLLLVLIVITTFVFIKFQALLAFGGHNTYNGTTKVKQSGTSYAQTEKSRRKRNKETGGPGTRDDSKGHYVHQELELRARRRRIQE